MLSRGLIDERTTVRPILKRRAAGPWRPRCGKRLGSNGVVQRILSDPVSTGTASAHRHVVVVPPKPRSTGPRAGTPTCRQPRPRAEWIAIRVPAIIDESTHQDAKSQRARDPVLSFRNPTRNDYVLRCLLTCRACGLAMYGITTHDGSRRREFRYDKGHGKGTVARDRSCRRTPTPATVDELDAAVWGHVKARLEDPAIWAARFRRVGPAVGVSGRGADRGSTVGSPAPEARPRGAAAGRCLPGRGDRSGRAEDPPRTGPGPAAGPDHPARSRAPAPGRASSGEESVVGP